jgi:hypothetical protein
MQTLETGQHLESAALLINFPDGSLGGQRHVPLKLCKQQHQVQHTASGMDALWNGSQAPSYFGKACEGCHRRFQPAQKICEGAALAKFACL